MVKIDAGVVAVGRVVLGHDPDGLVERWIVVVTGAEHEQTRAICGPQSIFLPVCPPIIDLSLKVRVRAYAGLERSRCGSGTIRDGLQASRTFADPG